VKNLFCDLETRSPVPIKHGTHRYAEQAAVLLWSYARDDWPIDVWDAFNDPEMPIDLAAEIEDPDTLVWFHNGGQFDFVVLEHAMPQIAACIPQSRRRDTMVQAYCHGLPGKLGVLGDVLSIDQDKRKLKTGNALMRWFCIPQKNDDGTIYWNTRETSPEKWQAFMEYAKMDVAAMREVHRKVPKWNYRTGHPELALWHLDLKINSRGAAVDIPLAHAAVRAAKTSLKELADETTEATDGEVVSATQRDVLLKYILESHGVALPDMRADTLERRMRDENLPPQVRTLLAIRLQASMNSASKYTALLNGVSSDGRLRGLAQFCGASRTGRWAHRLFQPGNLMRPPIEVIAEWHRIEKHEVKDHHIESFIRIGIAAMLAGAEGLVFGNVRALAGAAVRGAIIAPPGRKLVIADLANIEGRVAAWLAGEAWKLAAFRDYDTVIGTDEKGKAIRKGPDLYVLAYAKSFNVLIEHVSKENRQIGKVEELMFQYQGGVGAWITGAATYGIDLAAMTEAVWDVLADEVKEEARSFLMWLYEPIDDLWADDKITDEQREARKLKARYGLPEKTFIACDAIKRLWRRAHPEIVSYWKVLENTVIAAIQAPGVTLECRKLKVRCDGAWLRIGLPSGRALCYLFPKVKNDKISFTGMNTYTHSWSTVGTYGGKLFENVVQAVARDVLAYSMPRAEAAGYEIVLHVHDEIVADVPDTDDHSHEGLAAIMVEDLDWSHGLPLAAAGFTTGRYYKG
jgi:DNA polymerase